MRKIMFTFLLTLSMIMLINIVPTKAFDNETELDLLIRRIDHINEIYNSNYYILSEEEFINSEITDTLKSYDDYVKHLLNNRFIRFFNNHFCSDFCRSAKQAELDI